MPASFAATRLDANRERVEPRLLDLMAQSRRAGLLPGWLRTVQARRSDTRLSAIKGRGMEYAESRPYQAGDDVRALDWRVTARSGKPHTKLFREERERPVYLCVDLRPAMYFATHGVFKSVQAARAASLLAWKAQQSGDRVGGLIFTAAHHEEIPPGRGKPAVIRLAKHLVNIGVLPVDLSAHAEYQGDDGVGAALARLRRLVKPGSLVIILSDFRGFDEHCHSDLASIARHSDVMNVFVYDQFEAQLPLMDGRHRVTDGARELEIVLGDARINAVYREKFERRQGEIKRICREHNLLFAALATDADPLVVLQRSLGLR